MMWDSADLNSTKISKLGTCNQPSQQLLEKTEEKTLFEYVFRI